MIPEKCEVVVVGPDGEELVVTGGRAASGNTRRLGAVDEGRAVTVEQLAEANATAMAMRRAKVRKLKTFDPSTGATVRVVTNLELHQSLLKRRDVEISIFRCKECGAKIKKSKTGFCNRHTNRTLSSKEHSEKGFKANAALTQDERTERAMRGHAARERKWQELRRQFLKAK